MAPTKTALSLHANAESCDLLVPVYTTLLEVLRYVGCTLRKLAGLSVDSGGGHTNICPQPARQGRVWRRPAKAPER